MKKIISTPMWVVFGVFMLILDSVRWVGQKIKAGFRKITGRKAS